VPRRGAIDTAPGPGRPGGLYGHRFAAAPVDQVLAATTIIEPATLSNLVAMEAPAYGRGDYTFEEITGILTTAVTGFGAAVAETERLASGSRTVIHTGWWGCGAYGGNQELMALLQLQAAEWAEVDEVGFHIGSADSEPILQRAHEVQESLPGTTADLVAAIVDRRYQWGASDGN
jgi:Poly (ADP-ribose) glycohydrolase (PARG)